ncbi:MAG: DUF106 domain-containing protein, partial [Halobacteriaceae archaeon]
MASTEQKIRDLVAEDPDIVDALEYLLDREGPVEWAEVNDELTSGQWGRLIERGVLEDVDSGFRIADRDGVEAALYGDDGADDEEAPDASWTSWDKAAGLLALSLFPGYYFAGVRSTVGGILDVIFGPLDAVLPFHLVILILAVLTGLYSSVLQGALMDSEALAYYQERMQEFQQRQEAAKERGDDEEMEELREEQMEQMAENMGMFKLQFRPMAWIMLLTIPVFLWMFWMVRDGHITEPGTAVVFPLVGPVETWTTGILGPLQAWIVWYFLCS